MEHSIRKLEEKDIPEALVFFGKFIDWIHKGTTESYRQQFKDAYTEGRFREYILDPDLLFLVLRVGGEMEGMLMARITDGVAQIHWVGISPGIQEWGLGKRLLREGIREFRERGCYQAELFCYPKSVRALERFKKMGFKERARIDRSTLGTEVVYMVKELRRTPVRRRTKRIIIAGTAGQGVKLMAEILANILAKLQKEVSLNVIYGPSVRGGEIEAELIYSDEKIRVPFIDRADICLVLAKSGRRWPDAREIIVERGLCEKEDCTNCDFECPNSERVSFARLSTREFGTPFFINMIALGTLMRRIGINLDTVNFSAELPKRFLKENLAAILYGYSYRE